MNVSASVVCGPLASESSWVGGLVKMQIPGPHHRHPPQQRFSEGGPGILHLEHTPLGDSVILTFEQACQPGFCSKGWADGATGNQG